MSLRTRRITTLAIVLGLLVIALPTWAATRSSASTPGDQASAPGSAATPGPSANFGFSKAVQAKIDQLNAELEQCLLAHGARRVPLSGGGWTYTDPGGRPSVACAQVQARVNAYADGEEYQTAVAAIQTAVQAYATCLARHGVASKHGKRSAEEQEALVKAQVACGGTAADAAASG